MDGGLKRCSEVDYRGTESVRVAISKLGQIAGCWETSNLRAPTQAKKDELGQWQKFTNELTMRMGLLDCRTTPPSSHCCIL